MKLDILIVEDDITSQNLFSIVLTPLSNNLYVVDNGIDAIETFKNNHIDLILMDIRLNGINGIETTTMIREISKDVIIIGQSAYILNEEILKFKQAGTTHFLTKPINLKILINIIKKYFPNLELKPPID